MGRDRVRRACANGACGCGALGKRNNEPRIQDTLQRNCETVGRTAASLASHPHRSLDYTSASAAGISAYCDAAGCNLRQRKGTAAMRCRICGAWLVDTGGGNIGCRKWGWDTIAMLVGAGKSSSIAAAGPGLWL